MTTITGAAGPRQIVAISRCNLRPSKPVLMVRSGVRLAPQRAPSCPIHPTARAHRTREPETPHRRIDFTEKPGNSASHGVSGPACNSLWNKVLRHPLEAGRKILIPGVDASRTRDMFCALAAVNCRDVTSSFEITEDRSGQTHRKVGTQS